MESVSLLDLWLPILVSAVLVFIASAIAWMFLPHHNKDILPLPKDSAIPGDTKGLTPGVYMWPHCGDDREAMKSQEFKQAYKEGPWGSVTVLGGAPNMGKNMGLVFVFYIVVGVFVGYITSLARAVGAEYLDVFRVAGAAAVAIYALGQIPGSIFFGKPLRACLTDFADAVVYGLLTAGIFAWLWPAM